MWALVLYELGVGCRGRRPGRRDLGPVVAGQLAGAGAAPGAVAAAHRRVERGRGEAAQRPALRRLFRLALFTALPAGDRLRPAGADGSGACWATARAVPRRAAGAAAPLGRWRGRSPPVPEARHSPPGPLYPLYVAYVAGVRPVGDWSIWSPAVAVERAGDAPAAALPLAGRGRRPVPPGGGLSGPGGRADWPSPACPGTSCCWPGWASWAGRSPATAPWWPGRW